MAKKEAEAKEKKAKEKEPHKAGKEEKPKAEHKEEKHKKKAEEKEEHKAKKEGHKGEEKPKHRREKEEERHKAEKKHVEIGSRKEEAGEEREKEKSDRARVEEGEEERRLRRAKKQKPKRGKPSTAKIVELKPAEIEEAIIHLANEGHSPSEIGMILRDQYGIPKIGKALGKKLGQVLAERKLAGKIPEDLMNLIIKSVNLRKHLGKNKKDMSAKRGLLLTVSKIRALEKYYKKKGKLPLSWRYTPETAALLAK